MVNAQMRVLRGLLLAAVLQGSGAGIAAGQDSTPARPPAAQAAPRYRHRILGVFDTGTGEPIEGARVLDVQNRVTALTTRTGTVSLIFLPEGLNLVRIEKMGYQPQAFPVQISESDTVPLTILLTPTVNTLPTVVTKDSAPHYLSPGLKGFEERRAGGLGHFMPEVEMRKHDNQTMTSVVRTFPGLFISCRTRVPRRCVAVSTRQGSKSALSGGTCPLDVYIDGVPSFENDLEVLNVNQFAGIEYYAGGTTIPPQYNKTGSSCGVLLFWTRER
jgi:hypothetical protein